MRRAGRTGDGPGKEYSRRDVGLEISFIVKEKKKKDLFVDSKIYKLCIINLL